MKYRILICLLTIVSFGALAQAPKEIMPLKVGDKMPDIEIKNLRNHSSASAKISDFKGKLLILDYWATWCKSCFEYFPHVDQLQRKFSDQVQFILVNTIETKDTEAKAEELHQKLYKNAGYKVTLPYVNEEPVLGKLFPFKTLSQYVWIGADGMVKAITDSRLVTPEGIQTILSGGTLHTKQDLKDFDRSKPLPVELFDREEVTGKYRSMVTGYIEGISEGSSSFGPWHPILRVYQFNARIQQLLGIGNGQVFEELSTTLPGSSSITLLPNSQIIFETSNPRFKADYLNMDDFDPKSRYTYELILPDSLTYNQVKPMVRADMERYFNIKVARVEKKHPVLILKTAPQLKKSESTYDIAKNANASEYYKTSLARSFDRNAAEKYLRNATISQLLYTLNGLPIMPVLTDEVITHESQRYDFDFPVDIYDYTPDQLKNYLKSVGFEVVEEERVLPFVIFSDKY